MSIHVFTLRTPSRRALIDVTREVEAAVMALRLRDGAALVWVPHTTAAVTVNEGYDPAVASDVIAALEAMVPAVRFAHTEGNSDAHLLSILVGASALVPVEAGRLGLGRWQRIFFCEFDGPRTREVQVRAIHSDAL